MVLFDVEFSAAGPASRSKNDIDTQVNKTLKELFTTNPINDGLSDQVDGF
jgi:hypothetical protein